MASLLLAVIYLAFISLGLPDSLLGAAWPVMHGFFGVPVSFAGLVSMLISGSTIVSSLMSERLTRRLGTQYVTLLSVLLTAAAMGGFALSRHFWMLCLWAVPYGLGAGSIDAALNNYVALHYSARSMSWLHCFWGVGTILSPQVMSRAIARYSWQAGYGAVALIQGCIALVLLLTLPLWRVHPSLGRETQPPLGVKGALGIRGVKPLLLGFFSYCSLESICMLWIASFLMATRGIGPQQAAAFASLFFIGMTGGRFVSGLVSDRLGDRAMIRLGVLILFVGVGLTAASLPTAWTLTGCVIMGLGCAPVYPSIIHATPNNFGPENAQAIIGVQMASAYLGSTLAPPVFGWASTFVGLGTLPLFVGVLGIDTILLLERAFSKK